MMPEHRDTPMRKALRRACSRALFAQTSDQWEVVRIGQREGRVGNVHNVFHGTEDLAEKDTAAIDYIKANGPSPRYVMLLDDDDLISRTIVERALDNSPFDVMADSAHAYFDVTTGLSKCVRLPGYATSTIHSWDTAVEILGNGRPLFAQNHYTTWKTHYEEMGARIALTDPASPIYVRVISPTGMSSQGHDRIQREISHDDLAAYRVGYKQHTHGVWNDGSFEGFDCRELRGIHKFWSDRYGHLDLAAPAVPTKDLSLV